MFLKRKLLAIFSILFFCFPGVMAQTVSFAEPNTLTHKDVYLYAANGSLMGLYNTTSTGISLDPLAGADAIFTFKPQYDNPIDNPGDWFQGLIDWANSNAIVLFFIAVLIGIALKRW